MEAPETVSQYRPIACCNVLVHIWLRLKKAKDYLAAENQAVFVQGRSMVQNILIYHDLLRYFTRKTTLRCLMSINLREAYDMVSWEFLEKVLRGYGFPTKFIKLVMIYVTTLQLIVKLNGEGYGSLMVREG